MSYRTRVLLGCALAAVLGSCDEDQGPPQVVSGAVELSNLPGLEGCSVSRVSYNQPPRGFRRDITVVRCRAQEAVTTTTREGKHDAVTAVVGKPPAPACRCP